MAADDTRIFGMTHAKFDALPQVAKDSLLQTVDVRYQKDCEYAHNFTVSFCNGKWTVRMQEPVYNSCSSDRIIRIIRSALEMGFPEGPEAYEDNLTLDFY